MGNNFADCGDLLLVLLQVDLPLEDVDSVDFLAVLIRSVHQSGRSLTAVSNIFLNCLHLRR